MGYYVSLEEFKRNNKSIDAALALTFFLGIFGIQRFYLQRYVSGLIILVALFVTAWQALWVIIPLTIIELIQLSVVSEQDKKEKASASTASKPQVEEVKDIENPPKQERRVISDFIPGSNQSHQQPIQHQSASAVVQTDSVVVYDVSNIQTSTINIQEQEPLQPYQLTKWATQLELPYERHNLRIPQLRKAVYDIYEELAEYVDQGLRRENSSLEALGRQAMPGGYSYYNNILYTIFCMAEGEVTHHYSGGGRGYYDSSFSYQLLQMRTNEAYVEHLKQYVAELVKKLPAADEEVRKYYGLTKNGFALTWWDKDGELRGKYKLPNHLDRILTITPSRSTKIYEIPPVRAAIFLHYYRVLLTLEKQRELTPGWSQRMTAYLNQVFDDTRKYVSNPYGIAVLNIILKLCEQAVRSNVPYARPLDTTKELASLSRIIPKDAATAITTAINDIKPLKLSDATLQLLREQNPTAWKSDTAITGEISVEQVITLLNRYDQPGVIDKVAKDLIKRHDDPKAQLLALYQASVIDGSLDKVLEKKLSSLVHHAQLSTYNQLVLEKKKLSITLAEQLASLGRAPRKRVVLNDEKLAKAHDDHNRAIKSVVGYLGEEADDDSTPAPVEVPVITRETLFAASVDQPIMLTDDQKKFLGLLIDSSNGIEVSVATEFTRTQKKMLNSYLQSLNKILYQRFEDQVIVQGDGRIGIEDEYIAAVKGLL